MKPKGGARAGAGRPKGLPNKDKRQLIAKASEEGIMPLEFMLKYLRYFDQLGRQQIEIAKEEAPGEAQANAFRSALSLIETAKGYADSAAPYLHPKLSSIQANVNVQEHEARLAAFLDDE